MNHFSLFFTQRIARVIGTSWLIHTRVVSPKISMLSKKIFLLIFVLGSLAGCGAGHVGSHDSIGKHQSAIIVVPGYYGTRLVRNSDEHLVWISASEALFGDQPLTLPVQGLGLTQAIDLRPDGILDHVPVIPYLYEVDVYGALIDELRSKTHGDATVIPFTYDWRRDLLDSVKQLDARVQQIRKDGIRDITLVAHSLGGLIVSYYLRYGTQEIASAVETWEGVAQVSTVVMAGVPFLGVMNSLRNMNYGVTVKLNTSLLTAEAYSSFPSSYYTLPLFETDRLMTPNLDVRNNVIRNPESWKQSGWGLLNNTQNVSPHIIARRTEYTTLWLHRSKRFLALLRAPLERAAPRQVQLFYISAKGSPTLAKGIWLDHYGQGPDSLYFDNVDPERFQVTIDPAILYDDGDETVTVRSAWLPAAYRDAFQTTVQEYEVSHTELVTHPQVLDDIVLFLNAP